MTASTQFGMAAALRNVAVAEKALWEAARRDVDRIAEDAIAKLEAITTDSGGSGWSMTFTVVGAVVGVVGTVATGGTGGAILWASAGAATSLLGAADPTDEEGKEYPAGSPSEIVEAARSHLSDLSAKVAGLERSMQATLRQDVQTARGHFPVSNARLENAGLWRLVLPRPQLVVGKPLDPVA